MNRLMVFVLLGLLLAPLPWAIALNHQTKQCAGYWGGDEWAHYDLPSGWKAYYPSHNFVETEVGSCQLSPVSDFQLSIENCCKELGYTFVSTNNIGAQTTLPFPFNMIIMIALNVLGPFLSILVVLGMLAGVLVLLVGNRRVEPPRVEPPHVETPEEEYHRWHAPERIRAWGETLRQCSKCSTLNTMSLSACRKCSADLSSSPTVNNPFL